MLLTQSCVFIVHDEGCSQTERHAPLQAGAFGRGWGGVGSEGVDGVVGYGMWLPKDHEPGT